MSNKFNSEIQIGTLNLNLLGNFIMKDVSVKDPAGDEIFQLEKIDLEISIIPLIYKTINFDHLEIQGLKHNLEIDTDSSTTNLDFIINAFANSKPNENKKSRKWEISVSVLSIERSDFSLTILRKLKLHVHVGQIKLLINASDINNLDFKIRNIDLNNSSVSLQLENDTIVQDYAPPFPKAKDDPPKKWNITSEVQNVNISNFNFDLDVYNYFNLISSIPTFMGEGIYFSLLDRDINSGNLQLDQAEITMVVLNDEKESSVELSSAPSKKDLFIKDFKWNISSKYTSLQNCSVKFDNISKTDTSSTIDMSHFHFKEISGKMTDAVLEKQKLQANLKDVSMKEKSGFNLLDLSGRAQYSDNYITLESLHIKSPDSKILADISVTGEHLESIFSRPDQYIYSFDIHEISLSSKDLDYFLKENYLRKKNIENLNISAKSHGQLSDFQIDQFNLDIDQDITGHLSGKIKNILNYKSLCLENINTGIHIKSNGLTKIIDSLERYRINFPEEFIIESVLNGCLSNMNSQTSLSSSFGDINIYTNYKNASRNADDSLLIILNSENFDIGKVLNFDSLGEIKAGSEILIKGIMSKNQSYTLKGQVDSVSFNQKGINNINFSAFYDQKIVRLNVESQDSLINLFFEGQGEIRDSTIMVDTDLHVKNLDLGNLGFVMPPLKLKGNIKTKEEVGNHLFDGSIKITDASIISNNTFHYDTIDIDLYKKEDSVIFNIESEFAKGHLSTNIPLQQFDDRILDFYSHHFLKDDSIPNVENNGFIYFNLSSGKSLENLIMVIPELDEFHFDKLEGNINENKKTSYLNISIPEITYQNIDFDSLSLNIRSQPEQLNYKFTIPKISTENYGLQNLSLTGQTESGKVNNVLTLQDGSANTLLRTGFIFRNVDKDQYTIQLNPDSLIINYNLWSVEGENEISFNLNKNIEGNIHIENGPQSLHIIARDTLYEIEIDNFQLANLSSLIQNSNPGFEISGQLNMESNVLIDDANLLVKSHISLSDFIMQKTHFGDVQMELSNDDKENIYGEILLTNGRNELWIKGNYKHKEDTNPIKANGQIDFQNISGFNSFIDNLLSKPKGTLKGSFSLTGKPDKLIANGELDFRDVEMIFTPVNNNYKIPNGQITIENNNLLFKDFTLLDSVNNSFKIDGVIRTPEFNQFDFDLVLKANRFIAYNVDYTRDTNFYGTLIISMDASIKGQQNNPNILVDLSVDRGTNLTYILPPKNFDLVDSEGIVEFIDASAIDTVQEVTLQQSIGDSIFSKLNWIDLNGVLTINKAANFEVVIDPISGDYVQFGGAGNLSLIVQRNQTPRITGSYVFDRGNYEVSFYGMVKKSFEFNPGSSILWSGDPYNARLNLTANYNIRTASIGLVSREIYGLSDEEKSKYRRTLPYSVSIDMEGQLDNPKIGFGLDLPEEDRSGFPLVDTKLNQINEPGNESELTRQVFGLLTIGSFIPETTGPGIDADYGSALATTAAANSLNSILTNELNKLSGKYIKWADLDVGMQTFSDMAGGTQTNRTTMDIRLSKKLFNDRVTIEAQSSFDVHNDADKYKYESDQSNVHSDFAIIYDLREKGDYKLKVFERSGWDIIYKETRMGGVAVIFIHEFDKYRKKRKSR